MLKEKQIRSLLHTGVDKWNVRGIDSFKVSYRKWTQGYPLKKTIWKIFSKACKFLEHEFRVVDQIMEYSSLRWQMEAEICKKFRENKNMMSLLNSHDLRLPPFLKYS